MSRRVFRPPVPSFPNSIWERLLFFAKLHFAPTGPSNRVARTSTFPNGVWERGIGFILTAVILMSVTGRAAVAQDAFATDDYRISHADVAYYFDAISFDQGVWKFTFSKNSDGLQWRTNAKKPGSDSPDVTGLCKYKQTLTVLDGTWFEIVGKNFSMGFLPYDPGSYTIRALLKPGFRDSFKNRTREATELKAKSDGTYMVLIGID